VAAAARSSCTSVDKGELFQQPLGLPGHLSAEVPGCFSSPGRGPTSQPGKATRTTRGARIEAPVLSSQCAEPAHRRAFGRREIGRAHCSLASVQEWLPYKLVVVVTLGRATVTATEWSSGLHRGYRF
jgi:hypothetical protein